MPYFAEIREKMHRGTGAEFPKQAEKAGKRSPMLVAYFTELW
jgi:hypothetical protein